MRQVAAPALPHDRAGLTLGGKCRDAPLPRNDHLVICDFIKRIPKDVISKEGSPFVRALQGIHAFDTTVSLHYDQVYRQQSQRLHQRRAATKRSNDALKNSNTGLW